MAMYGVFALLYLFLSSVVGLVYLLVSLVFLLQKKIRPKQFLLRLVLMILIVVGGALLIVVIGVILDKTGVFPAFPDHN